MSNLIIISFLILLLLLFFIIFLWWYFKISFDDLVNNNFYFNSKKLINGSILSSKNPIFTKSNNFIRTLENVAIKIEKNIKISLNNQKFINDNNNIGKNPKIKMSYILYDKNKKFIKSKLNIYDTMFNYYKYLNNKVIDDDNKIIDNELIDDGTGELLKVSADYYISLIFCLTIDNKLVLIMPNNWDKYFSKYFKIEYDN